jgi:hypothetical protein
MVTTFIEIAVASLFFLAPFFSLLVAAMGTYPPNTAPVLTIVVAMMI